MVWKFLVYYLETLNSNFMEKLWQTFAANVCPSKLAYRRKNSLGVRSGQQRGWSNSANSNFCIGNIGVRLLTLLCGVNIQVSHQFLGSLLENDISFLKSAWSSVVVWGKWTSNLIIPTVLRNGLKINITLFKLRPKNVINLIYFTFNLINFLFVGFFVRVSVFPYFKNMI